MYWEYCEASYVCDDGGSKDVEDAAGMDELRAGWLGVEEVEAAWSCVEEGGCVAACERDP